MKYINEISIDKIQSWKAFQVDLTLGTALFESLQFVTNVPIGQESKDSNFSSASDPFFKDSGEIVIILIDRTLCHELINLV